MRAKLDIIVACFALTSLGLLSSAVFLGIALFQGITPLVVQWLVISALVSIVFGITADILFLTDKLLMYRLMRRLDQPIK